jgi:hypothetical protein
LRKLMMLAVMLVMVLVVAIPAIAQVGQELGNEDETGNVDLSFSVQSTGNNSNQCVTPLQFGNTGSNQNAQGFLQYNSTADDLEAEGGTFEFAPELTAPCAQAVQQSSAASSGSDPPSSKRPHKKK